ncbi:MAG: hypothetical protein AAF368_15895, partial [Planctomycetota bacterium]
DMLVSQSDYRRLYAQEARSEEAFRAAQEVLFAGNDILMLGFGASEEDLMQPFRRFVQRGRDETTAARRTFALMPSATCSDYRIKNALQSVRLSLNYDIFPLHYGGPNYRHSIEAIRKIEAALDPKKDETGRSDLPSAFSALRQALVSGNEKRPPFCSLFDESMLTDLERALGPSDLSLADLPEATVGDVREKLEVLENTVRSRAMLLELNDLNRMSRDWWDTWRQSPRERRAQYHMVDASRAGEADYLSVRHCTDHHAIVAAAAEDWPCLRQIREHAVKVLPDTPKGRRILRLTSPRGGGKSTIVNLLHRKEFQEYVFNQTADGGYRGAFIAHLSFSMEFASVVKAMTRFFSYWIAVTLSEETRANGIEAGYHDRFHADRASVERELSDLRAGRSDESAFERVRRTL